MSVAQLSLKVLLVNKTGHFQDSSSWFAPKLFVGAGEDISLLVSSTFSLLQNTYQTHVPYQGVILVCERKPNEMIEIEINITTNMTNRNY